MKPQLDWISGTLLAVVFAGFFLYGGDKPDPGPGPQPSVYDVPLSVALDGDSLTVTADIPPALADALAGESYLVQLKTDDGAWSTVAARDNFHDAPIVVDGVYVSGGRERLRRVRVVWPNAHYTVEEDVAP